MNTNAIEQHGPFRALRGLIGAALVLAPLVGCDPDDPGTDEAESGESETETGEPAESLAHDIDIARVELNQGVAIAIAEAGEWVGPEQRNAPIVRGRPGIVRVFWTLAPSFETREIEARLTLAFPDGTEQVRSELLVISGEPDPSTLSGSFNFELSAEDLVPGLRFSVSLWEVDPAFAEQPAPSIEPISPREGPELVGVQPEAAELEVVIVPVEQQFAGCSNKVDLDLIVPSIAQYMYMANPVQKLELSVRGQPIVVTSPPQDLSELLGRIQAVRSADEVADNVYYHGLYVQCDYQSDWGGRATTVVDSNPDSAWMRASIGLHVKWSHEWSVRNATHEVGHLQGLAHVECPGKEADQLDPTYPYEDGLIGSWGYGLFDYVLRDPAVAHDYMSYCYDGWWVSDWTWTKTFQRITLLTSWDMQDHQQAARKKTLLVGSIGADGQRSWWTTKGRIPADKLADAGRPRASLDGLAINLPSLRTPVPDADAELIAIELPELVPEQLEIDGVPVPADVLARARGQ